MAFHRQYFAARARQQILGGRVYRGVAPDDLPSLEKLIDFDSLEDLFLVRTASVTESILL